MRPECLEQFADVLYGSLDKREHGLIDFFEAKVDPNYNLCLCDSVRHGHLCLGVDGYPDDANACPKGRSGAPRDRAAATRHRDMLCFSSGLLYEVLMFVVIIELVELPEPRVLVWLNGVEKIEDSLRCAL